MGGRDEAEGFVALVDALSSVEFLDREVALESAVEEGSFRFAAGVMVFFVVALIILTKKNNNRVGKEIGSQ